MQNLDTIFAKSANYGSLTLLEHSEQVLYAIELFSQKFAHSFGPEIARQGAVLHDLGKAHPYFQRKIQEIKAATLAENMEWDYIHRHEISSLAFLPIFPKENWNPLIDMVVGHHKSILHDPAERGILDLINTDRNVIQNHLQDWENWSVYGIKILEKLGFSTRSISRQEAQEAMEYVIEYCKKKTNGYSPWRGLLRAADHFASAFMNQTSEKLPSLFEIPDLGFYRNPNRKNSLYPLSEISTEDLRKHTLVVAPTGAGKTDFLLCRCKGRIFYTLPFQASINAMWERIRKDVPNGDIRLQHSTSKIVARKSVDEKILQPLAGSSIKVLTPHQIAAIVFGTSGYESIMLDIQNTDVILDEIHTYSDYSRSMVLAIVETLLRLDCRVHIGTATMSSVLYNRLLELLGGEKSVYQVKLPEETLDTFDRHQIYKLQSPEEITEILKIAFANSEKVLVIYNTVGEAQEAYKTFQSIFPNIPIMLIHSRFRRCDRVDLERKLKTQFNGDDTQPGFAPCLVISTQVVEVSLDISFDRMITQCAPLDSLIQRFGRVNRKRSANTLGTYKPIHVLPLSKNSLPYDFDILASSFAVLPDRGEILKERSLLQKIDTVYPNLDTKEIDLHLIYKNGRYTIQELTNYKKAVLIEALQIESATCILEEDKQTYLTASWEERTSLEIPVNYKTISQYQSLYPQLEVGAYPFVIPQKREECQELGLRIGKTQ